MTAREQMEARVFAVRTAMEDRAGGHGLMAQMGAERFARYVERQLAMFEEAREAVGCAICAEEEGKRG